MNKIKIVKNAFKKYSSLKKEHDIILIRHAQSQFNEACDSYSRQLGIDKLGWNEQMTFRQFTEKVLFNSQYTDSRLSQKGKQQCINKKYLLKNIQIDLILVSPKIRALQTCQLIFGKKPDVPVIVKPILGQACRFACDITQKTTLITKSFPNYNFEQIQQLNYQTPYFYNISQQKRSLMEQHCKKLNICQYNQKKQQLMKLIEQKVIYQQDAQLRQRAWNIKQMLKRYKKDYKKIVVISHWYVITAVLSREFAEDGTNLDYDDIQNAVPYFANLTDLLKVK